MKDIKAEPSEYFASANSYSGFISFFDDIFDSRLFDRIFVLKGGPGTGKSTLIKKAAEHSKNKKYGFDLFKCSSDLNSFDGIIIHNNEKKVAILDGTAPHERDAKIPGAVDEIVNLGEGFNVPYLKCFRDKIIEINEKKNLSYQRAYAKLSLSSIFATKIKAEIKSLYKHPSTENKIDLLASTLSSANHGKSTKRFISSFSKNGYMTLDTLYRISNKIFSIYGQFGSDKIFLSVFLKRLQRLGIELCYFPSALDPELTEAIFIPSLGISYIGLASADILVDTTELINYKGLKEINPALVDLDNMKEKYLYEASRLFSVASDHHFELEDIYSPSMNFEIITNITDKIIKSIDFLLE